ncbi:MAG: hypothetical protein A2X08_06445 [Bacteroidetes bacterium GWA2_32_17]|nr:MAG: hypothetical protein A2X08_06445 [Bacteroidetes bacterium GWA2_32_17]
MKKFLSIIAFLAISGVVFGQLTLSFTSTNLSCNGQCNGSATVSVSGGTPPYTYAWNDSLLSTTPSVSDLCGGTYTVTATDAASNIVSGTVTISQSTAILLTLIPHNPTSPNGNDGYIETNVSGGTPPYTYLWDNGVTTSNIYNLTSGTYSLIVTDANGCNSSYVMQLYYSTNSSCSAYFMYQTGFMANIINFTGFESNTNSTIINYTWEFGDGTSGSSTDSLMSHSFNPGTYNVCLTITTDSCSSTYCETINVNSNQNTTCQAYYYYQLDSTNNLSSTYSFMDYSVADSSSTITSYLWNFSDGSSSTVANPVHTFGSGSHTICLTIQTSSGCTSTYCDSLYVGNQTSTCQAYFYLYPDTINVPPMTTYNFVDQSVPDSTSTIVSWLWNFGNGNVSTLQNPTGNFFQAGTYTICLTIATSSGCTSNYCDVITVGNNGCTLYANITTQSPTTIGGSDGYIESNVYGGTAPYSYLWDNGTTTANIYNLTSGVYTLNVIDSNGCQNTFYAELYEPYDTTGGNIVDTLYTGYLDSCLNFVPDSFYIASITTDPNSNIVSVVWVFVGGGQTATFTVTYTFSQYGNTLVVITFNCGTKTLTTYQSFINITNTSSVPEYGNENNMFVYPVPFSNKLNIDFITQKSENVNIFLIDASGRVLVTKKINSMSGVNNTEINTTQLSSGVYILNIETSNGIIRKQIVK